MGRRSSTVLVAPLRVQKMKMSPCGCYDEGGAYWGHGMTLYVAEDVEGGQAFTRAKNRKEALQHFKDMLDV